MIDTHVTLDPASLGPVGEKLREPLEQKLTSALQQASQVVDDHYAGESVPQVTQELLQETREGLHPDIAAAFQPDQAQLQNVAVAIVQHHQQP